MDSIEMQNLLKNLPNLFQKAASDLPADAAQSLQALAQAGMFPIQGSNQIPHTTHQVGPTLPQGQGVSSIGDPGPSSHPTGPPNLGHPAAAMAAQAPQIPAGAPPQDIADGQNEGEKGDKSKPSSATTSGARARGSRNPAMGTDEWARQRKDNHVRIEKVGIPQHVLTYTFKQKKEVERRRRGNINEGINELGRIVPNSSGEKAKGAILARAVQYIHHLKENEARNIEKWTLEKLLMDQAMGDLQSQLEEMRRLWEEERMARQRAESELELLRGVSQGSAAGAGVTQRSAQPVVGPSAAAPPSDQPRLRSPERLEVVPEASPEGEARPEDGSSVDGRPGKRPRTE
ncbi:hypothetical protein ID866_2778 [Astraeus odoratus]|nr:hypothetical protein ID866_2778 [Astraeus odoratus]